MLKIIEEPPAHCIFIFASTEVNKIPLTITSRCQFLQFQRFSNEELRQTLNNVISKEKIKIDENAILKIIQLANGAARDSLTILDQLISLTNNNITYDDVIKTFGLIDDNKKFILINFLLSSDYNQAILLFNELADHGINFIQLAKELLSTCLDYLVYKKTNELKLLQNQNCISFFNKLTFSFSIMEQLTMLLQELYNQIVNSADPYVIFQLHIFKICSAFNNKNNFTSELENKKNIVDQSDKKNNNNF